MRISIGIFVRFLVCRSAISVNSVNTSPEHKTSSLTIPSASRTVCSSTFSNCSRNQSALFLYPISPAGNAARRNSVCSLMILPKNKCVSSDVATYSFIFLHTLSFYITVCLKEPPVNAKINVFDIVPIISPPILIPLLNN